MKILFYVLYNLLLTIGIVGVGPFWGLYLLLDRKRRREWKERLGFKKGEVLATSPPRFWIHAASVGEALAATPLVAKLISRFGADHLLFTSMTSSGKDLICRKFPGLRQVGLFPVDFLWLCWRRLKRENPSVVILYESELWPNFLLVSKWLKIPVVVFNGSLSERSYRRFRRLRFLTRPLFEAVDYFGVQDKRTESKLLDLGVSPDRISVTGNTKIDVWIDAIPPEESAPPLAFLEGQGEIWVAGSVRTGEIEILLHAYVRLQEKHPRLRLVVAPRHLDRIHPFSEVIRSFGFKVRRRSEWDGAGLLTEKEILLLDTLGELAQFYRYASVAFVGGTLVPIGGHNILEPALLGKPVLFGPFTSKVEKSKRLLLETGFGREVGNSDDIVREVDFLLSSPERVHEAYQTTLQAIRETAGATDRNLRLLDPIVGDLGSL